MKIRNIFMALVLMFIMIAPLASADVFNDMLDYFGSGSLITGSQTLDVGENMPEIDAEPEIKEAPVVEPEITEPVKEEPVIGMPTPPPPEPKPVPEVPSCPPIPTSMWCPDQKALCPQTTDENGCTVWDCDACKIPPYEGECPVIPRSQFCPDRESICPQTTDEKGCTVWDCAACETIPREPFEPKEPYEPREPFEPKEPFKPKLIEPRELEPPEAYEQREPKVPEGCSAEEDEFGNFKIICEKEEEKEPEATCPPRTEIIKKTKQCQGQGGMPKTVRDDRGCKYVDCQFGREEPKDGNGKSYFEHREMECPSPEDMNLMRKKCESIGGKAIMKDEHGCKFIDCVQERFEEERGFRQCPDPAELHRKKEECGRAGMMVLKDFDERTGCPMIRCERREEFEERREEFCDRQGPPKEAYKKCEYDGGKLIIKFDDRGCVKFVDCVRRGNTNMIEYEEVHEVPDVGKLIDIAFKLEELKKEFDELSKKSEDLAKYHESQGDKANAEKFYRVAGMFEGAKGKVNELMLDIRSKIGRITKQDLITIKHDVKYIKEVILNDILYVMFTPAEEISEMRTPEFEREFRPEFEGEEMYEDQGMLFDQNVRICQPFEFHPPEDPMVTIKIKGLEGKDCIITGEVESPIGKLDMVCKYPNYAFGMVRDPEKFMEYCEGTMKDMFGMGPPPGGPPGPPMGPPQPRNEAERCMMECVGHKPCRPGYDPDPDCQRCEKKCFGIQEPYGPPGLEPFRPEMRETRFGYEQYMDYRKEEFREPEPMRRGPSFGVEFGVIGCNERAEKEWAREDCFMKGEFPCEIRDIPDTKCGAWVVCERDEGACAKFTNWCSKNPGACPGSPGYEERARGEIKRHKEEPMEFKMCSEKDERRFRECGKGVAGLKVILILKEAVKFIHIV